MKIFTIMIAITLLILGCQKQDASEATSTAEAAKEPTVLETKGSEVMTKVSLSDILANQPEEAQQRFQYRNPNETIEFFGIEPGFAVLEALPGGGWYSKILQPFLGPEGKLIGVDYDYDMWPNFNFVDEAFLEKRKNWTQEWQQKANQWSSENGAPVEAYTFATLPQDLSVDAVLFIRALHNLHRFEEKGEYLSKALKESYRVLKEGGIVGVVQHQVDEDRSDEWANGSRGYLKKSSLVKQFEAAGFTLVSESAINSNPKDQPGEEDFVWRLPPSLSTSKENEELKNQFLEVGESNRMTLLFKKS